MKVLVQSKELEQLGSIVWHQFYICQNLYSHEKYSL